MSANVVPFQRGDGDDPHRPMPAAKRAKARTRFPEGWAYGEPEKAAARKAGMPTLRVLNHQWEKFADHHMAKGSLMLSWPAAWRTWCHNYAERSGTAPQPRRSNSAPISGLAKLTGLFDEDGSA